MNSINKLNKKVSDLESSIGSGETHFLNIEWEDGTHVATWEMRGDAFVQVINSHEHHDNNKKVI